MPIMRPRKMRTYPTRMRPLSDFSLPLRSWVKPCEATGATFQLHVRLDGGLSVHDTAGGRRQEQEKDNRDGGNQGDGERLNVVDWEGPLWPVVAVRAVADADRVLESTVQLHWVQKDELVIGQLKQLGSAHSEAGGRGEGRMIRRREGRDKRILL